MCKFKNITINAVLWIFAAIVSVGCMTEKDGPLSESQNVMIELSVSAGNFTKSIPTDGELTVKALHVYAFYGERLAGYASRQSVALGDPFYMDLRLPETGVHNVDFYLVANPQSMSFENRPVVLSENMTKAQLQAIRFTDLSDGDVLPMYCFQTEAIDVDAITGEINSEDGHEGHHILSQKIAFELTRSLAKLSVYAAKAAGALSDPQILGVELLSPGTREFSYLFPQTEDVLNAVASNANNHRLFFSSVTIRSEIVRGSEDALNPDNYDNVFMGAYLPEVTYGSAEWNLSSGNPREAVLHIEYTLGEGQELRHGYVFLPPLVRNNHIKVCILINSEGNIIINYVVADWSDNDMWGDGGIVFDYPNHSYLRDVVPVTPQLEASKPESPAVMSETSPFVAYFQMKSPAEDAWIPTLMGLEASDCTVEVYTQDGMVPVMERPIKADPESWFMIKVTPTAGKVDVGDEVRLAITYRPAWSDVSEYLMINGSSGNYFWPFDDPDRQDANYVIITMVN